MSLREETGSLLLAEYCYAINLFVFNDSVFNYCSRLSLREQRALLVSLVGKCEQQGLVSLVGKCEQQGLVSFVGKCEQQGLVSLVGKCEQQRLVSLVGKCEQQ